MEIVFHDLSIDQWFPTFLGYGPAKFQNKVCGPVDLKTNEKCQKNNC